MKELGMGKVQIAANGVFVINMSERIAEGKL